MGHLWKTWKKVLKNVANFQTNLTLTIIFLILILPASFIIKMFFSDFLKKLGFRGREGKYWQKRPKLKQDLSWAKKLG